MYRTLSLYSVQPGGVVRRTVMSYSAGDGKKGGFKKSSDGRYSKLLN